MRMKEKQKHNLDGQRLLSEKLVPKRWQFSSSNLPKERRITAYHPGSLSGWSQSGIPPRAGRGGAPAASQPCRGVPASAANQGHPKPENDLGVCVPVGEVYLVGRFMEELAATQWRALLKLRSKQQVCAWRDEMRCARTRLLVVALRVELSRSKIRWLKKTIFVCVCVILLRDGDALSGQHLMHSIGPVVNSFGLGSLGFLGFVSFVSTSLCCLLTKHEGRPGTAICWIYVCFGPRVRHRIGCSACCCI